MKQDTPICDICGHRAQGIFCNLVGSHLARLDREKTVHEYQRGQVIFYEGNPPLGIYCICSGRVKLYKMGREVKPQVIRLLGPGEIMGYRALLANEPCSTTAQAIETATICVISKQTLFDLVKELPELAFRLLAKLGHELGVAEEQMMHLTQESVRQRTARLLLFLLEGSRNKQERETQIKVPFLRREMAEMIGTTPESLARTLRNFAQRGLILLKSSQIYVNNLGALEKVAYGPKSQA